MAKRHRPSRSPLLALLLLAALTCGCGPALSLAITRAGQPGTAAGGPVPTRPFQIVGAVALPDAPMAGATITAWSLGDTVRALPLGQAVTGVDGRFAIALAAPLPANLPLILAASAGDNELYAVGRAGSWQSRDGAPTPEVGIDLGSSIVAKAVGPALAALAVSTLSHPDWDRLEASVDTLVAATRREIADAGANPPLQAALTAFAAAPSSVSLHQAAKAFATHGHGRDALTALFHDVRQAILTAPAHGGVAITAPSMAFGPITFTVPGAGGVDASNQVQTTQQVLKNLEAADAPPTEPPAAVGGSGGGSSAPPAAPPAGDPPVLQGVVK